MTTELHRFTEAYATMTVATYEPLILRWISLLGIRFISNSVATRASKAAAVGFDGTLPAALALSTTVRKSIPGNIPFKSEGQPMTVPIDIKGQAIDPGSVTRVDVPGYPRAVAVGSEVFLNGVSATDPKIFNEQRDTSVRSNESGVGRFFRGLFSGFGQSSTRLDQPFIQGVQAVPITVSGRTGVKQSGFDFVQTRNTVQQNLVAAVQQWVRAPDTSDLQQLMTASANVGGVVLPVFWPGGVSILEALSPIGIAHYYRQLYFNKEEGVGPIEEAFTIAPLETLEVVYQTVRKQIHEEIMEQGLEIVSESAVEEKNLDEVSDKVSSMVQQDVSASMSANASGGIGVWQVGASASASFSVSSQRSREFSTRRLKEVTSRASERITKSFSIKTRDVTEVTTTNMTRRVIRNDSAQPVSYGLRRVLRRVNVKVQDLGPRLVWQLYLRNPGDGLARSRFVHFREATPISVPEIPAGVPPRPAGGVETESMSTSLVWNSDPAMWFVTIVVKPGADRDVTAVRIDSITDLEGGGKDDEAPAPHNEFDLGSGWDPVTRTFTARIGVLAGDSLPVQVTYSYTWNPSQRVLDAWEALRQEAVNRLTEEAMTRKFEQDKQLITEKSKIKSRPANDLRREERYEVMNRMVSYLFGRGDDPSEPTPLEIEYFHRYFDIDGIFNYTHPSWWKPRFGSRTMGIIREAYEITAESEPAPLGSSLGWLIQLDGDRRRNEFLNSPWLRICIPIRRGREREAIQWLANHLEGEVGFSTTTGPLTRLLAEVESYRTLEDNLGQDGADYVTVDSTPGAPADPATPEGVYPVIDEFQVTVPTDGFVYDELIVSIP